MFSFVHLHFPSASHSSIILLEQGKNKTTCISHFFSSLLWVGRILLVFFSSHVRKPSAHGRHIVDIHHANFFIFTSSFPNVFFCIEPSTFLHIFCSFFIYLKYIPVTSETNTSRRLPTCCFFTLLYFHFSADVENAGLLCFVSWTYTLRWEDLL